MEIDHIYSRVLSTSDYQTMKDLGFKCNEKHNVEHPAGRICSFVYLRNWQYLEFVFLSDLERYRKECREDIELYGFEQFNGISLRAEGSLKSYFEDNSELFEQYRPLYEHRNYRWKENSTDYLPGWNFLRFEDVLMPNTCVWFTEYEPIDKDKKKVEAPLVSHPNTVNTLHGIVLEDVNQFALGPQLEKGVELYQANVSEFPEKKCFVRAVVLKAECFETFLSVAGKESNFNFKERPAYRFERDVYCFDIIIV